MSKNQCISRRGTGSDTLDIQGSTILGKMSLATLETMTSQDNRQFGATTVDNARNFMTISSLAIVADVINGAVKYTGSTDDDSLTINAVVTGAITMVGGEGTDTLDFSGEAFKAITFTGGGGDDGVTLVGGVGGAIKMIGNDGTDSFSYIGIARKAITFTGGLGDDTVNITGTVLGAITANMGAGGANMVNITAVMAGSAIKLQGGAGIDTFTVSAWNAGALTANLGADNDEITTAGIFKSLKLDAGLDAGVHNGAEKTLGKITRKNFI